MSWQSQRRSQKHTWEVLFPREGSELRLATSPGAMRALSLEPPPPRGAAHIEIPGEPAAPVLAVPPLVIQPTALALRRAPAQATQVSPLAGRCRVA